ncbi:MAG: hypothetical protein LC789_15455 [Actinobacteria bacterium]|nr:hypothetical protein [Actinomycetota bacterium]MCA1720130.1 hypothetical protein [Actinomycetota bacterium]
MRLPRLRQLGLAGAVLTALLAGSAAVPAADASSTVLRGHPVAQVLRAPAAPTVTGPRQARATRTPAATRPAVSTWQVTYCGFESNPQAKQAFQAAVDTWAGLIDTPNDSVPIQVKATFKNLGDPNILGQAGPTDFVVLDPQNNGVRTSYPVALANALRGRDSTPSSGIACGDATTSDGSDITAEFNSGAQQVYYGTDGQLPDASYVDFETIVLHELGHGLGFLGSMDVDSSGRGSYGAGTPYPDIYDRFTVRSAGSIQRKPLLSYPNTSTALGEALTSGAVYWDGALGKAAYNGRPPRLYAPSQFLRASSFSHLSDVDFPAGDPNSLMTPFVENNEVIHEPGPVVLGMFADMGYRTPQPGGQRYEAVDPFRLLDTRGGAPLGSDTFFDLRVTGGSVPAAATAVVLDVTATGGSSASETTVFPTPRAGSARPVAPNVRAEAGATRTTLLTVPVGTDGMVRIYTRVGSPQLVLDVLGWYGPGGTSAYRGTGPLRVADTRDGTGGVQVGRLDASRSVDVQVTGGSTGVPATADAVVVTVTALNATTASGVRVVPRPSSTAAAPLTTSLSVTPGEVATSSVITKVSSDGYVRVTVDQGATDVVLRLTGWYDDAADGLFHVLGTDRVLAGLVGSKQATNRTTSRDVAVTGVSGVPVNGVAAVLAVLSVTASGATELSLYPAPTDGRVSRVPTLDLRPRETAATSTTVRVGATDGAGRSLVRLTNARGQVFAALDLMGWFGP